MFDRITDLIMIYTALIDSCNETSKLILNTSKKGNIDSVEYLCQNRSRLISILSSTQGKIENLINNLQEQEINKDNLEIIKSWSFDVSNWIQFTSKIDEDSLDQINQLKDDTSKEIASMFRSKMAFKGYDLKNTTR